MSPLSATILGALGLLIGPSVHHAAVVIGRRDPLETLVPRCESCGWRRPQWRLLRCDRCKQGTSARELLVTVGAGFAWGVTAWVVGWSAVLPAYLVFATVTLALVVTDLDHKLIPNRILYPGGAVATALLVVASLVDGRFGDLIRGLGGGAAYFAVLFGVALVARGGFGFGDVKLAALLGLFTGFASLRVFLVSVFFTGVLGGIPAIVLLVSRRAGARDELPYGPAMIGGAWLALVWGESFLRWYGT